jgi:methylthioribose-1-phosphate isomerase
MYDAAEKLKSFSKKLESDISDANQYTQTLIEKMKSMLNEDILVNKSIGNYGALDIFERAKANCQDKLSILTHCNTGSLATAGY